MWIIPYVSCSTPKIDTSRDQRLRAVSATKLTTHYAIFSVSIPRKVLIKYYTTLCAAIQPTASRRVHSLNEKKLDVFCALRNKLFWMKYRFIEYLSLVTGRRQKLSNSFVLISIRSSSNKEGCFIFRGCHYFFRARIKFSYLVLRVVLIASKTVI